MKVCDGSDEAALRAWRRAVAFDPSVDGESFPRWPALTTMILRHAVQAAILGAFLGTAGLPIARAEEPVPPSDTKLKRLLADAMLDNAALQELPPNPPSRPTISDEATMKRTFRHDMTSLRIEQ